MKILETLHKNVLLTEETLSNIDYVPIFNATEILKKAKEKEHTVFTFGNGGSHCNASHFAQDLLKACGIKAICISDMIPTTLAYMNDESYTAMFFEPLRKFKTVHSVVIGFSCSGSSNNIILGLTKLCEGDGISILFTGNRSIDSDFQGELSFQQKAIKKNVDVIITVPNPNIRIQESCHSVICHVIIEALLDE